MNFVDFCYKKAYGENSLEMMLLRSKLQDLFNEYKDKSFHCAQVPTSCHKGVSKNAQTNSMDIESELFKLELYLAEPKFARNTKFDVLAFWKSNQFHYPELATMARDILSIPISTVASESAFSVGGRVLDQFRSSLKSDTVEAIVCSRDWLFGNKGNFIFS
ncbi:HAT, C-terminal dimerization domain containing protein [Trema orientale]|uniref:HAT, C-terminal dimerization domain containing protein n=1 Tax=Trema orientale TaxID=63057 RepID=A0A2P5FB49_TREOI|nr:HAT, C-terminal dimerization domain containing protein [Trema orientale]